MSRGPEERALGSVRLESSEQGSWSRILCKADLTANLTPYVEKSSVGAILAWQRPMTRRAEQLRPQPAVPKVARPVG